MMRVSGTLDDRQLEAWFGTLTRYERGQVITKGIRLQFLLAQKGWSLNEQAQVLRPIDIMGLEAPLASEQPKNEPVPRGPVNPEVVEMLNKL